MKQKKYIIVDTFNGLGYSDSTHTILEANSFKDVIAHCRKLSIECHDGLGICLEEKIGDKDGHFSYGIGECDVQQGEAEDYGCIHFAELTDDLIAIAIWPCTNEYIEIKTEDVLNKHVEMIKEHSADYEDLGEEDAPIFNYCHHEAWDGDGEMILERINR